jgi:hypothetical protein
MISTRHLCSTLFAFACSTGVGCLLTLQSDDNVRENTGQVCSPAGSHSHLDPQGYCICDAGYGWCTLAGSAGGNNCCPLDSGTDDSDTNGSSTPCVSGSNNEVGSDGQCHCLAGFDWCSSDINDLNCCLPDQTETSEHPEGPCTAEQEGQEWCSHTEAMGASGSTFYVCVSGVWTKSPQVADAACKESGFDFAYGCTYDPTTMKNSFECGYGTGLPCTEGEADSCSNDLTKIMYCEDGRRSEQSCVLPEGTTCETADGGVSSLQACEINGTVGYCVCVDDDGTGTDSSDDSNSDSSDDTTSTDESSTSGTDSGSESTDSTATSGDDSTSTEESSGSSDSSTTSDSTTVM